MITKRLSNFPDTIISRLKHIYNNYYDQLIEIKTNHYNTKMYFISNKIEININITQCDVIIFMISPPNMGKSIIHTDRTNVSDDKIVDNFGINVPLKIDKHKSKFITGKYEDLSLYPKKTKKQDGDRISYEFEYDPDLFEEMDLKPAILINGYVPHGWTNYSDEERIMCRLEFGSHSIETIHDLLYKKGWL